MKTFRFLPFLPIALSLALSHSAMAEPVSLFDGKTLEGWNYNPKIWKVEDGMITGGSHTEKIRRNSFISTKESFQNFELNLTIKCSGDPEGGLINSGIQVRSQVVPGSGGLVAGYQIDCGDGYFGQIWDEHRRGAVIADRVDAEALAKVVDIQGWNHYRIRAEGPRIRVWINDVLATDFTETNPKVPLEGIIAPQVHKGGVALVQVKDISIVELPASENIPTWKSLGGVKKALKLVPKLPKKKKPDQPAN